MRSPAQDPPSPLWERSGRLGWLLLKWIILGGVAGILSGSASALFLWLLDQATQQRGTHPGLIYFLPLAGGLIGLVYHRLGGLASGGNNLLLERIRDPKDSVPFRMAPLILIGTVLTHLFGGSAGREGTAVQMGGTLADFLVKPLRLSRDDRRILIMAGISAGFGSVFGTPIAGVIFGLEVQSIGRIKYDALVPCLVAGIAGDVVCREWGIRHLSYASPATFQLSPPGVAWIILASILFAAASGGFTALTHWVNGLGRDFPNAFLFKPIVGGVIVIGLTWAVGNQDYNGLGIPLIQRSFFDGQVPTYAFLLKILFTSITLGTGFKGGEVTPLFCIGATLGTAFAHFTYQDPALFATLGFVAVFAGAANTPLACTIMGVELFGSHLIVPIAISCVLTYMLTGHRGIYLSQEIHVPKGGGSGEAGEVPEGKVRR